MASRSPCSRRGADLVLRMRAANSAAHGEVGHKRMTIEGFMFGN